MQEIRRDAENLISAFRSSPQNVNYKKISSCINYLMEAQWMDNICQGSFQNEMKIIEDEFINYAFQKYEQLLDIDFDLSNYQNLEKAWNYLNQIQQMSLEVKFQQIQSIKDKAESKFNKSTSDAFERINLTFNIEDKPVILQKKLELLQDIQKQYYHPLSIQNYFKQNNILNYNQFFENQENLKQDEILNQNILQLEANLKESQQVKYENAYSQFKQNMQELDRKFTERQKKQKIQETQQNILKTVNCKTIDELKSLIEDKNKKIKIISDGYINLLQTKKLKKEREEILQKNGIKNIQTLQKEIDKLKQELNQGENISFEKLDCLQVQQSLNYIEESKKIKILKDEANKAYLNLQNFLKNYLENISKQLFDNFKKIKSISQIPMKEAFQCTQQMASYLQQIIDLGQYQKIFEITQGREVLNYWKKNISYYLNELNEEMYLSTQNNQSIKSHLDIAKAMTYLDFFIDSQNNYQSLYNQFQSKVTVGIKDINLTIINLIQKQEFQQAAAHLQQLDGKLISQRAFEYIKDNISFVVNDIIGHTKIKSNSLSLNNNDFEQNIKIISENLYKVQNAKRLLPTFLEKINLTEKISQDIKQQEHFVSFQSETCKSLNSLNTQDISSTRKQFQIDLKIEQIYDIIQNKLKKYIKNIEDLIIANDFNEAENNKEKIESIKQILSCIFINYETLLEMVDQLQEFLDKHIEEVVKKYIDIDLEQYSITPPKYIFEKLSKVQARSVKYIQSINQIQNGIQKKIFEEISEAKQKTHAERLELIQKIEQSLYFLPDQIKSNLEGQLKQQRNDIKRIEDDYEKELENLSNIKDVTQLKSFLKGIKVNKLQNLERKFHQLIVDKCDSLKNIIENYLNLDNIKLSIDISKKFNEYYDNFSDYQELKGIFLEIKDFFLKKINNSIEFVKSISSVEKSEEIRKRFEMIANFVSMKQQSNLISEINLKDKIENLFFVLSQYFKQQQEKQENSLKKFDFNILGDTLDDLKKQDEFLKDIKNSYSSFNHDGKQQQYFEEIQKYRTYEDLQKYIEQKLEDTFEVISRFEFQKGYDNQKIEYFQLIDEKLFVLEQGKKIQRHLKSLKFDVDHSFSYCIKIIEEKVKSEIEIANQIMRISSLLSKEELQNLNFTYENMFNLSSQIKFQLIQRIVQYNFDQYKYSIMKKVQYYADFVNIQSESNTIVQNLVQIKKIADNIYLLKSQIHKQIDNLLTNLRQDKNKGGKLIGILATILEREQEGIGQIILSEHGIFKGQSIAIFNQKTQKHNIDYVLDKIQGSDLSKIRLKDLCQKVQNEFQKKIKKCVYSLENKKKTQEEIILDIVKKIKKLQIINQQNGQFNWDYEIKQNIPELLYLIFSLWSIQNIQYYNENSDSVQKDNFILQPHPGQIVSILRMLGLGYAIQQNNKEVDDDKFKNNLIEIGTGEGKSITLAVVTCILVIFGADVSCACYSEYLSSRDYESFLPIFEKLGITKNIQYGPFTKICENIINEDGDIRNRLINMIQNNNVDKNFYRKNKRPQILLIDEVDVFFSSQFYGSVYTPLARLKHQTILDLVSYLWKERLNKLTYFKAKNSNEFQKCCQYFKGWQQLLEEALKEMIEDLQNFEHEYVVTIDGKIGYKEQDGISFNISFGYKTLFIHYKEFERNKIAEATLKENTFIGIRCGSFSFAQIPHQFQYILGATGTLRHLSNYEKKIIEETYKIKQQTFIPSVFGENKLKFAKKDDVYVENQDNYFKIIVDQIYKKIDKRAVLIFFETQEKLLSFYESSELAPLKHCVKLITEQISNSEKNMVIKSSTTSGSISLISKIFGRGTDFFCRDQEVINNGGTHVISTFFSEERSEEIQILGRTARQGQDGSVSFVLLENDLEKFLGANYKQQINQMRQNNSFYQKLNEIRENQADLKYQDNDNYILQIQNEHENAKKFAQSLKRGLESKNDIIQHLIKQNKGPNFVACISRTVCLMDATGSMQNLLNKAKITVEQMFSRTVRVLQESGVEEDCFQMQFAVYRDYDQQGEGILQSSTWESKPDNLIEFIKNVKAVGGDDYEEAIEIGLWHANQEHSLKNISQVILIGDAPSKSEEAIKRDREKYGGETYWSGSKFSEITYYQQELEKLKFQKIPVHCFYLHDGAKQNFEEISQNTGGQCSKLDINSANGSQQLTDIITQSILFNIGGDEYVKSYKKIFGDKNYS